MVDQAIAVPMIAANGIDSVDLSWAGLHGREIRTGVGGLAGAEGVPHYWLDETLRA